jgi:hypothetical protein
MDGATKQADEKCPLAHVAAFTLEGEEPFMNGISHPSVPVPEIPNAGVHPGGPPEIGRLYLSTDSAASPQ